MAKLTGKEMYEMHFNDGLSFTDIADKCGISKQAVQQDVKRYALYISGKRGRRFNINTIVYQGIYDYFLDHPQETLLSLTKKLKINDQNGFVNFRRFITGQNDVKVKISLIKKVCDVICKPFEEVFVERRTEDV